ncbi:MAG TPA: histidine--tRNA ligase [Candidatus Babeliales bacterium]|jgi:histidyl-tRNA synthetase|nr:histidine--tRNA ligase [Candidatus Babeliales bacterium]
MIPRVKGTQDFIDCTLFNFIIDAIKKHLTTYHFSEIQTPILESVDLFFRSLGQHTDVVSKEMFIIESRQEGSEDRICLRPEGTAPTVRAFNEHHIELTPWKVFSYGPMFRYERPQKGRFRQFHQVTMEIIGSGAVAQDVQFIAMLDRFFHEVLTINSYALALNFLGCSEDREKYLILLRKFMDENPAAQNICDQCQERKKQNIMRIFDCKNPQCQEIYRNAPYIAENLCQPCTQEWQELQKQLNLLSVSHVYRPTLVRGLDYYNKTVFEFVSKNLGAQDTFCGGGRYNQLVEQLGGSKDQSAIGAAFGMERVMLLLEPMRDKLNIPHPPALHIIIPMTPAQHTLALLLADELQAQNICTDILFEGSIKNMMRKANKFGAAYALILGENEQQNRTVMVKNMTTGIENSVAQVDLIATLKK